MYDSCPFPLGRPISMYFRGPQPLSTGVRNERHSWLVSAVCALALFAVLYAAVQAGAPLPIIVLGLVVACLAACTGMMLTAARTRRRVDEALRRAIAKGELMR